MQPHFLHVVAGLHIGPMTLALPAGRFGAVLSVGARAGRETTNVHHRHIPLDYENPDPQHVNAAAHWARWQSDPVGLRPRNVLVRSERGLQRPSLVVAVAILELGGTYRDAIDCIRYAHSDALTEDSHLQILRDLDRVINARVEP